MPESDPAAPTNLFYFSALNSDDRKLWVRDTLLEGNVYFRKREQLNDPNELRPSIVFEGSDKEIRMFASQLILARWPCIQHPAVCTMGCRQLLVPAELSVVKPTQCSS